MFEQDRYGRCRLSGRHILIDVLVVALLASGVIYCWHVVDARLLANSRTACLKALETVNANAGAYRQLLNDAGSSESTYTADDLSDGRMLHTLVENMAVKPPETVSCNGRNPKQMGLQTAELEATALWYEQHAQSLRRAIDDVGVSRDMKVLNDARIVLEIRIEEGSELFRDSYGRVRDESTRTSLSEALRYARKITGTDPKSYRNGVKSLENAINQVVSSIETKAQTG